MSLQSRISALITAIGADIKVLNDASATILAKTLFDAQGDIIVASAADVGARLALGAAGKVPTSNGTTLVYGYPPGYELSYVERTTNLVVTPTTASTASIIASSASLTFDGSTRIKIEMFAPLISVDTDGTVVVDLWEDATDLGFAGQYQSIASGSTTSSTQTSAFITRFLTPSAGSHTYHFKAWKSAGTATVFCSTGVLGAYLPGFIRISIA